MIPTVARLAKVSAGRVAARRQFPDSPTMRVAKNLAGWSVVTFVYSLWPLFVGDLEYYRFPIKSIYLSI
ncbi:uncharacterized protein SAPINGB_P004029 [Magnusiomyces paraingens]|uniref:Uncharacterized protein n=1 Tax=Magnusiomyces paraingens TaxID=2606893 RepID=A0A5E8BZU0_9ASCO|nr:uncharacterized protein SAPINGB_P004029 [Saprochaete ingens]VVT54345.1 unnamed protein product [Saprochaete ingens]